MLLKPISIFTAGRSPALRCAQAALENYLTADASHATHLLLPVPSFDPNGCIKGNTPIEEVLAQLPPDVVIIGGNLNHPALDGYMTIDLLRDPFYVAKNAAITAHCALGLILSDLPATLPGQQVLVVGPGRIGKCMAELLKSVGAAVTIAARKEADRAMAEALDYRSTAPDLWDLKQYRIIINTVPSPLLDAQDCARDALLLDLASERGIIGNNVNWARGLPGVCAPETSGKLIAETVLRLI